MAKLRATPAARRSAAFSHLTAAISGAFLAVAAAPALAHDDGRPIAPLGEIIPHHVDSGVWANASRRSSVVFSDLVVTPDALWTRLYFFHVELEGDSRIRFTSLLDNEVQELDAAGISMWGNTSAYFNGGIVMIELIASPGTSRNRFVLSEIGVEFGTMAASSHCSPPLQCGLCHGQDDRVPSNEKWACRLVSSGGGCSAAIYNVNSCVVSAGHCMGANMVIQFNVPLSNPDCSINHPPVEDQFPILDQISQNGGVGADWAVMTSGVNTIGQTAYQRFGEYRPLAASVPSSGPADVWGYGVTDNCILRQTQQHSSGEIINLTATAINYTADVTCGNSGSSLLQNGQIIGIVTHCTFTCPPNGNTATRIDVPAFVNARAALCSPPVEVHVPGDYPTIQAAINDVGNGSTITVAPGTYNEAINFIGKNLTVVSSDGPGVTTINATGQNASAARFSSGEGAEAVLDGFTLTGGAGSSVTIGGTPYQLGGGIYAAGSSPRIVDCIIAGNTAHFGGGAFNNGASPMYDRCIFAANTANPSSGGGAFNFSGAAPTFINSHFVANAAAANGGGMSSQSSSPIVTASLFIDNVASGSGGAVRNIQNSAGQFINCAFESNSAGDTGGAFVNESSSGTLIADSTFCDNSPNDITGAFTNGGGNEFLDHCPDSCAGAADLNCDGSVDVLDLLTLLDAWGTCDDCDDGSCPADFNGDCIVDVLDLLFLLDAWG
jgi:hypothetical protein